MTLAERAAVEDGGKNVLCVIEADDVCRLWEKAEDMQTKHESNSAVPQSSAAGASCSTTLQASSAKRGFFSKLTERAARFAEDPGSSGSLTLLFAVTRRDSSPGGSPSASPNRARAVPLSTVRELQSLCDGHLWFSGKDGRLSIGKSLSRFGLGTDIAGLTTDGNFSATLHKIGGNLRLRLAQREADLSLRGTGYVARGDALLDHIHSAMFSQDVGQCGGTGATAVAARLSVAEQVVVLLAAGSRRELSASSPGAFLRYLRAQREVEGSLLQFVEDNDVAGDANALREIALRVNRATDLFLRLQLVTGRAEK